MTNRHGGKRVGSGRKSGLPSKRITIPYELIEKVESLIAELRSGNHISLGSMAVNQDSPAKQALDLKPNSQTVRVSADEMEEKIKSQSTLFDTPRRLNSSEFLEKLTKVNFVR